jgi:spermidine/putrescine-binding protein
MNILRARWLLWSLAALVAACSGNSSPPSQTSPTAAAASENVLNIYNWSDFIGPSIISHFEKESGIRVHYDVYETNEMMEVKLPSGHTNYDIVVPGGSFFEREVKAGVYRKLDKSLLPNLKNLDPGAVLATAVSAATTYASGVAGSVALVSEAIRNDTAVYPAPEARARLVPMRARSQDFTRSLMRMWTRFKTGE